MSNLTPEEYVLVLKIWNAIRAVNDLPDELGCKQACAGALAAEWYSLPAWFREAADRPPKEVFE